MNLFYTPDIKDLNYTLSEEESKHCTRVLRLTIGSIIHLTDGRGGLYKAEIIDDNNKACRVNVVETIKEFEKRNYQLTIALAPTKNIDRTEWFLEKCTEIGIDRYIPLESFHSERRAVKIERLEKVVVGAIKQSLKAYCPKIDELTRFEKLVKTPFDGQKFIAHCNPSSTKQPLNDIIKINDNILILIGPEGDFSIEEVEMAMKNGFFDVSLGNSRLRTETAGIVACHTVALKNQ